jgi:hypothetical protein
MPKNPSLLHERTALSKEPDASPIRRDVQFSGADGGAEVSIREIDNLDEDQARRPALARVVLPRYSSAL